MGAPGPFDPAAGQWTIVNGYRGEGEHAPPTNTGQNYALFAFDFRVRSENVYEADRTCELGPASGSVGSAEPGWDTGATQGVDILSPVDGRLDRGSERARPSVGIAVTGFPGLRGE